MNDAFDGIASLFWTEAVGRAPANQRLNWRQERAINTLIDGYILDMDITPQATSHLSLADKNEIWLYIRNRLTYHAINAIGEMPRIQPSYYYSIALLPRILLAAFLRSIGYRDLRRVLFEEAVSEDTIPDIETLLFAFVQIYVFEYDLMSRGSALLGSKPQGDFYGDPVFGEQIIRWEDPACKLLPPPMATALLGLLTSFKDQGLPGNELHYVLTTSSLSTMPWIGIPDEIVSGLRTLQDENFRFEKDFLRMVQRAIGNHNVTVYGERILRCTSRDFMIGSDSLEAFLLDVLPLCHRVVKKRSMADTTFLDLMQRFAAGLESSRVQWLNAMSRHMPLRMLDLITCSDEDDAHWAVTALRHSGSAAMCPLLSMLRDGNAELRIRAATVLINMDEPAIVSVTKLLADKTLSVGVSEALASIGQAAIPFLHIACRDNDEHVRRLARETLAKIT